jgi:hypothetical protein
MTTRRTACSCGQLHLTIEGEPSRIAMCHCLECQRRTGAVISNQARLVHDPSRHFVTANYRIAKGSLNHLVGEIVQNGKH